MKDRVPKYPGRVRLIPVDGQENIYDVERVDEPIQEGTPINKQTLLTDESALVAGLTTDSTPNQAICALGEQSLNSSRVSSGSFVVGASGEVSLTFEFVPRIVFIAQQNGFDHIIFWVDAGVGYKTTAASGATEKVLCTLTNTTLEYLEDNYSGEWSYVAFGSALMKFKVSYMGAGGISTNIYSAAKDTTWKEYCDTSYSEGWGGYVWGTSYGYVKNNVEGQYLIDESGNLVSGDELIFPTEYGFSSDVEITFNIDSTQYKAIKGMSWNEFVQYNHDKFAVRSDGVVYLLSDVSSDMPVLYSGVAVKGTDIIVPGRRYTLIEF